MPIYEYRCSKCHHTFDMLVGVTAETTELKCPQCGSKEVTKGMGSFAVRMGSSSTGASSCATGTCCPTCN